MLNAVTIVRSQPTNHNRDDGFWSQISTMRIEQIIWHYDTLYAARNPFFAAQINGGVYRSIDGGVSWDTLYSVAYNASAGVRLFLHPTDSRILFIINGSLYKSTNSGQSWTSILSGNGSLVRLAINPKNPLIMYATKTYPFGNVYKTTTGGGSWSIAGDGLMQDIYFAAGPIDINSENPEIVLLGTNNGLYRTTNAGGFWDTTAVKGIIYNVDIHPNLTNVAFASSDYNWSLYKTSDLGNTWYRTNGGKTVNKCVFNFEIDSIIYNSGNQKSTDTGDSWYEIDSLTGWTDLANDRQANSNLYGSIGEYGLYTFRDIILLVDEIHQSNTSLEIISFPNPFNSTTTIQLTIPRAQEISIRIYDVLGRMVKAVFTNSIIDAGQHRYYWDGKNDAGNTVSTGIYFCKISTNQNNSSEVKSLKLILLK